MAPIVPEAFIPTLPPRSRPLTASSFCGPRPTVIPSVRRRRDSLHKNNSYACATEPQEEGSERETRWQEDHASPSSTGGHDLQGLIRSLADTVSFTNPPAEDSPTPPESPEHLRTASRRVSKPSQVDTDDYEAFLSGLPRRVPFDKSAAAAGLGARAPPAGYGRSESENPMMENLNDYSPYGDAAHGDSELGLDRDRDLIEGPYIPEDVKKILTDARNPQDVDRNPSINASLWEGSAIPDVEDRGRAELEFMERLMQSNDVESLLEAERAASNSVPADPDATLEELNRLQARLSDIRSSLIPNAAPGSADAHLRRKAVGLLRDSAKRLHDESSAAEDRRRAMNFVADESIREELPFRPVDKEPESLAAKFRASILDQALDAPLPKVEAWCKRCGCPARRDELLHRGLSICAACQREIYHAEVQDAGAHEKAASKQNLSEEERAERDELEARATAAARLAALKVVNDRKRHKGYFRNSQQERSDHGVVDSATVSPDASAPNAAALNDATPDSGAPVSADVSEKATLGAKSESPEAVVEDSPRGSTEAKRSSPPTQAGAQHPRTAVTRLQRGSMGPGVGNADGGAPPSAHKSARESGGWNVLASHRSLRTRNPIRELVQGIAGSPNPDLPFLDLSVGDPTRFGNLRVPDDVMDEYCRILREGKSNGYTQSFGSLEARTAIAQRYSLPDSAPLTPDDVLLTSGVSGALELALGAVANAGDNVLVPKPGFPLFKTMLDCFGVEARYYAVLPTQDWEIRVEDLAVLADEKTAAIVVNNPSNPCGSVYSTEHIRRIVEAASALRLPIIADEVYADMVFSGRKFTSIAAMSKDVPVLSVGGLSKQFVVPGWRTGWLLVHDRNNVLEIGQVRKGLRQLSTRMLMPNAPTQALIPYLMETSAKSDGLAKLMLSLEENAEAVMEALSSAAGISCVRPQGSMYLMAGIDVERLGFADDLSFAKALRSEESVFVLPGQCFQAPNFMRIVFCAPPPMLREAGARIVRFCARHEERTRKAMGSDAHIPASH